MRVRACVRVCVRACVCVCLGQMGEGHWHKKFKDLDEKLLDHRVGLEPTSSTILERRLSHSATGDLMVRVLDLKKCIEISFSHLLGTGSVCLCVGELAKALAQEI